MTINDRTLVVSLIKEANSNGCRVDIACKNVGIDKRTFERWRKFPLGDRRKGPINAPANKLSESERNEMLRIANTFEYRDKPPSQIVPLLADNGIYLASESSFYRILKANDLASHRSRAKPPAQKKPAPLIAYKPNQVYSWDITYLRSNVTGRFFYLYLVMDIYSRKIVGFKVHEEQSSDYASRLIKEICISEKICRDQLTLHSDNGGPMKGSTMLATLQGLGVVPSFSRPAVSDDNAYSEALFRTIKYCPKYPSKPFVSLSSAEKWVEEFVFWYNEEKLHSGIRFVTPNSRHRGEDKKILRNRDSIYQLARSLKPNRWSRTTRNWSHIKQVSLNCLKRKKDSCSKEVA